jgi:hypothetical protein
MRGRKAFFSEEKKQKTFVFCTTPGISAARHKNFHGGRVVQNAGYLVLVAIFTARPHPSGEPILRHQMHS